MFLVDAVFFLRGASSEMYVLLTQAYSVRVGAWAKSPDRMEAGRQLSGVVRVISPV